MVKIIVDSVTGLTKKEAEKMNLGFIPLVVIEGDKQYYDGTDIDQKWILEKQKKKISLKTSQPSVNYLEKIIKKESESNDEVLVLTISSKLSGTYANTSQVAKKYSNVTVVDSKMGGYSVIGLVKKAQQLLKTHQLSAVVVELEKIIDKIPLYMYADDIMYLVSSGRVKPSLGKFAKLMNIKPLMKFSDGAIKKVGTVRNIDKAIVKIKKDGIENFESAKVISILLHGQSEGEAARIKKIIEKEFGKPAIVNKLAPTVAVHVGPGSFGITIAEFK